MADETGGRRTRSTRSTRASQEMPVTPRATRTRGRKQNIEEEEEAHQDEIAAEPSVDDSVIEVPDDDFDQSYETVPQTNEDNGSSNFGFDDNLTYEQQSNDKDGNTNQTDEPMEQETFMADLADIENANSFPSGFDDNSVEPVSSQPMNESDSFQAEGDYQMVEDSSEQVSLDKTEDTLAQSDDVKVIDLDATCLDADEISEDELPAPAKPEVQDAEEVSDEELPGPKMAELPADTEVVSEEELPALKKEGKRKHESDYDPTDPTEEVEEKKLKTEEKHRLPDLDKYWKAVKADQDDFNAWTYLLQYVDSESDVEAAREAYDSFLSRYCYCYGYWRKYADYEKKKGSMEKCDEVFERGLKAIPLSIDLWIHYLTHVKQKHESNREYIRSQFERALAACGLEFRSDKLWDGYIKWENEERNLLNIVSIYDRLLATPTQGYKTHWENFRELVNNNQVHKLLSTEEFKKYRADVRKDSNDKKLETDDQVPPGEDEPNDHVRNEEEADAIRKLIINKRKKINKATVEMINKRWSFEEGIKRPYFHVKQLERIQLKNWKEYLDYEIELGDRKRILVLFERCLIACALYEEFWLKLIRYLETNREDAEFEWRARDCFERACNIHHPDKPSLLMMWAAFEETHGKHDKASEILQRLDQLHPNLLQVAYFRINLERRQGNFDKCIELYQQYVASAKNKSVAASLSIKHARFLNKIRKDFDGAMGVLKAALAKDPLNTRIALQIIDLAMQRENVDQTEILAILDAFMTQDSLDPDQKLLFAQRKVEFLEDFGDSVKDLHEAQKALQVILEKAKEHKKKSAAEHESSSSSKKSKESSASNGNPYSSTAYGYNSHYGSSAYPSYASSGQYDYNQQSYYQQGAYANQWGSSY